MIQQVLTSIGGVGAYGVISVTLFFAAFVGILIWVLGLKRSYLDTMRGLPLADDAEPDRHGSSTSNSEARHD